ncbi:MAG TPA: insulinase family protein [Pyrinomonadaceae bacterium]
MKRLFLVLMALSLTSEGSVSQTIPVKSPSAATRITSVEGVTEYRLANGLGILMVPDSSKPTITINVTYLVGSRSESYGETGMAHLLEHLLFKGTQAHANIPDELSKHGAQANATTSYDRTNYFETFAASKENLDWALSMESDRMLNSFIAKKDLDSEMTVVRNEFERGENDPIGVLNQRVVETAYLWHNYGHPTIGARSDIEGVPVERLQRFYHAYYRPDNAVLIVAGKFDENETLKLVQSKFGPLSNPPTAIPEPYTEEPLQDGQREITLHRVGETQGVVAAYHIPADGHPDTIALSTLAYILSDPAAGRLRKHLVDTQVAVRAEADLMSQRDPGLILFSAMVPKDGNLQTARDELIKVIQNIPREPVTRAELDRARAQMSNAFEKMMTDPARIASALSDQAAVGDWRLLFWERDQMQKLSTEDLSRVATKYLIPSNLTIGMFIPDDKPLRAAIPATPDYAAVLKGYTGNHAVETVEQFDPTPSNIEAHTKRFVTGPIKIAFLPKPTRGNLVNANLYIQFGNEESLRNRSAAKRFVDVLLMRGTAGRNIAELRDALTANKTQMTISGGASTIRVSIVTDRDHFAPAMRLAAEVLQQPNFSEQEFELIKRQMLTNVEGARSEPEAIANTALQRALSPYPKGHIRYVATLDEWAEQVRSTTIDDVKNFYKAVYGVGAAQMAFVGDFDPKETENLAIELFGKWKSPVAYQRVPFLYKQVTPATKSFNTPDKENAVFLAGTNIELNDEDPQYPALVLGNYMLGGGFLNSRLATRVRQKEGLSYGISSTLTALPIDKAGSFGAMAISAPQNESKVEKAFREEVSRAVSDGFTAEEVAAAKSGYIQSRQLALSDDSAVARFLADGLYVGRDLYWEDKLASRLRSLTPEEITRAMRQFIDPNKLVTVAAGDFSRVSQAKGTGYSYEFVDRIIGEEINPMLYPGGKPRALDDNWKPDWNEITGLVAKKYDARVADLVVSKAKVGWYQLKKQWPEYTSNLVKNIETYGTGREGDVNAFLLNNYAWDVFQYSNNKAELTAAISWLERILRTDPENLNSIDTYANLLYKIKRTDEAITLESKGMDLAAAKNDEKELKIFRETLDKMKKGQPTWPNN